LLESSQAVIFEDEKSTFVTMEMVQSLRQG